MGKLSAAGATLSIFSAGKVSHWQLDTACKTPKQLKSCPAVSLVPRPLRLHEKSIQVRRQLVPLVNYDAVVLSACARGPIL
jgi:hypothetical protein